MDEKALKTLEFYKIIKKLKDFAVSPMGKDKCEALRPYKNLSEIEAAQKETSEAESMYLRKGRIPLGGISDIAMLIRRSAAGGILIPEELIKIADFLYVCGKVSDYGRHENKGEGYEYLDGLISAVKPLPNIEAEINRCIESTLEISDNASSELRGIRRDIKIAGERVHDHLNKIIYSPAYKLMLQDPVITIRNDRYCVPIKMEYKGSFPGMVHDQSNSGSTLFIEPLSVVEQNNKIKELQIAEKAEINHILQTLTGEVSESSDILMSNRELLSTLDFIFAKAELSVFMKATKPVFNTRGYINIKKGRHPLLDPKTVVPVDIYLGDKFTTLLITGPNTGGKTVALKTIGLFTLMGQAGLHIPATDNSELSVFENVFPDIGDEQSIEQSLSTFSSHMTNIVDILNRLTPNSLVLLDELGAGTDPTEGAALAMAIIERLTEKRIPTAVTTHYSELKVYALSEDGVENACCEFDTNTLRPTYRLLIGVPGKSNAFAISKRLGLPEDIINLAGEFISREDIRFEELVTDLEITKRTVLQEKDRAEEYRREAEKLKNDVERQKNILKEKREKILSDVREEARILYQRAKEDADGIIKEMNKMSREGAKQSDMNDARSRIKTKLGSFSEEIIEERDNTPPENLKIGDRVYIFSFKKKGTVIALNDTGTEATIQTGVMKIKVPVTDLAIDTEEEKHLDKKSSLRVKSGKSLNISTSLDLRGQTVDEAILDIDKYLDDASMAGLKSVTIIHGKGTGALRTGVIAFLRNHPHVASYRKGEFGEGDLGVTIVEIK